MKLLIFSLLSTRSPSNKQKYFVSLEREYFAPHSIRFSSLILTLKISSLIKSFLYCCSISYFTFSFKNSNDNNEDAFSKISKSIVKCLLFTAQLVILP